MTQLIGQIFHNRYRIQSLLGQQRGRRTCLATDLRTGNSVVVKLVLFGPDFTWDDLKLFEREAGVLKSLAYPTIPKYLDSFEVETELGKGFTLVQSYIQAKSLQQWMQSGRTFSESELRAIATSLLKTLDYLHQRHPAVVHRDVKPSNILLSDRSWWGQPGQVYLVDFGSVQTVASSGTRTVVGTYGYMPPEQFGGQTLPASDLYALGATLIYLATGQSPDQLPQREMRLLFEGRVTLSVQWIDWLKWLTEPSLERRAASAKQVLAALEHSSSSRMTPVVQRFVKDVQSPVSKPPKEKDRSQSISSKSTQPPIWSVAKTVFGTATIAAISLAGLYTMLQSATNWKQQTQITCQSADLIHTDCVMKYRGLLHLSESEEAIKDVKGVRIHRDEGHDGDGRASIFYSVNLHTKSDYFVVDGYTVSGIEDVRQLQELRNRLQEYIEHPRETLTIPFGDYFGADTDFIVCVGFLSLMLIMTEVVLFIGIIINIRDYLQSVSSKRAQRLTTQSGEQFYDVINLIRTGVLVGLIALPFFLLWLLSFTINLQLNQTDRVYQNKDYEREIADYSEALKHDPQDASAYAKRGAVFADKKDYDRALADYTQALELDPKNADVYFKRGNVFDAQKNYDRALANYNQALEFDKQRW